MHAARFTRQPKLMEIPLSTFTVPQALPGHDRKAAYTDTDTLQRPAPADGNLPGSYTDIDVLTPEKTGSAGRPGSYTDTQTVTGPLPASGNPGRYTDTDRSGR
jgi:hypothetical protein